MICVKDDKLIEKEFKPLAEYIIKGHITKTYCIIVKNL